MRAADPTPDTRRTARVLTAARNAFVVATAVVGVLLMVTGVASATTMTRAICDGTVSLTAADGPGTNKIVVTERADGDDSLIIGVRYGFTWRNQRSGATGEVAYGTAAANDDSWSRSWTITTGPGNVIVSWDYTISQSGCIARGTLGASAIAR